MQRLLRIGLCLLVTLLLMVGLAPERVEALEPVAVFSGTLNAGEFREYSLTVATDLDEYLFYSKIQGGDGENDMVDVTIVETSDGEWFDLQGEFWFSSYTSLAAGSYTLTVEANPDSTGPLGYTVALYSVPSIPAVFSGRMTAASFYDWSDFSVDFPADGTYNFGLGVTGGSYEIVMDGETVATVQTASTISVEVSQGRHDFELIFAMEQETSWSVEITQAGSPHLSVSVASSCPTLNESAGELSCVLVAQAEPSDGGTPSITYTWSSGDGSFNSTTGQWVNWTAPIIYEPGTFTVRVEASASGYVTGTGSTVISVQPVPEFPNWAPICLLTTTLLVAYLMRIGRGNTHENGRRKEGRARMHSFPWTRPNIFPD